MLDRQKRLNEVYEHLHNYFNIHTKGDFADSIKYARAYISSALNGNKKYLTDKLFTNICEAYPGVFDLNYLLTGEGSLLTIEEEVHNEEYEKLYNPQPIDQSSLINAAIAAKDEAIASLKRELRTKDDIIQALREQIATKDQLIAEQKARIVALEQTVADKDAIIRARDARILELERQIANINASDLSRYPFAFGAAEPEKRTNVSPYQTEISHKHP